MALTEVYVDPSIDADSGTGTIGDPYGDLEYAIERTTFDTTNGTRVNIKSGTAEILSADLAVAMADTTTTPAWLGTFSAPIVLQGYTSTAGDGGKGDIDGNAVNEIINDTTRDYVWLVDLKLHNTGAFRVVQLDNSCHVIRCEVYDCTSTGYAIDVDFYSNIIDCYIHDVRHAIQCYGSNVMRNRIQASDNCVVAQYSSAVERNIITKTASITYGILLRSDSSAIGNSIYSTVPNDAAAIEVNAGNTAGQIIGNLIQGFSEVGGSGISVEATADVMMYGANSVYDCTTPFSILGSVGIDLGGNEILTESPFVDAANGDFRPVDTGSVKEGFLPSSFP